MILEFYFSYPQDVAHQDKGLGSNSFADQDRDGRRDPLQAPYPLTNRFNSPIPRNKPFKKMPRVGSKRARAIAAFLHHQPRDLQRADHLAVAAKVLRA